MNSQSRSALDVCRAPGSDSEDARRKAEGKAIFAMNLLSQQPSSETREIRDMAVVAIKKYLES
jgi:hypothetical protein